MIAYAAIDLRGSRVVQLVGGRPDDERVSLPDPTAVALDWLACGFVALHVVDLDAALGTGDNSAAIRDVIAAGGGVPVQVGGGVRSIEVAETLFAAGAARVVVGTRAIEDAAWLDQLTVRWPGRVVVAADVRGDDVVIRGWTTGAGLAVEDLLASLSQLPLAGVLVTDVSREGSMAGVDVGRFERLVAATPLPLVAAGGIAGAEDLAALDQAGVAGAVIGMALYTGALDARAVARDYRK